MKAIYFVRPIGQMFNFKGVTGRAEYFTYTLASLLVALLLSTVAFAASILEGINWYKILPPQMLNEYGSPYSISSDQLSWTLLFIWVVLQFPMYALTTRRLRDQYAPRAAYVWQMIPIFGRIACFFYGFVPTFVDHPVIMPDGSTVMRSQLIADRRFRTGMILAGGAVGGAIAAAKTSGGGMELQGGPKVGVNRNASAFKADGSINNRTSILGGRKAHMRNGKPVRASRNKYTL